MLGKTLLVTSAARLSCLQIHTPSWPQEIKSKEIKLPSNSNKRRRKKKRKKDRHFCMEQCLKKIQLLALFNEHSAPLKRDYKVRHTTKQKKPKHNTLKSRIRSGNQYLHQEAENSSIYIYFQDLKYFLMKGKIIQWAYCSSQQEISRPLQKCLPRSKTTTAIQNKDQYGNSQQFSLSIPAQTTGAQQVK